MTMVNPVSRMHLIQWREKERTGQCTSAKQRRVTFVGRVKDFTCSFQFTRENLSQMKRDVEFTCGLQLLIFDRDFLFLIFLIDCCLFEILREILETCFQCLQIVNESLVACPLSRLLT